MHATKVTGLAAFLVVGLGKAGDPVASMSDSASSISPPAVSRASNPTVPERHAGRQPALQHLAAEDEPGRRARPATPATKSAVRATESQTLRLSVSRFGLGTDVVGRELVGQSDKFRVGATVVFWTHVRDGRLGDTIRHRWFHGGRQIADVVLPVNSPSWRTHSRYTLPGGAEGDWTVELRDGQDRVLAMQSFRCQG